MKYISKINNKTFYFICLLLFSFSINQYYGYLGVYPIDTFLFFDSGYRVLNGHFPFKDFWAVTGPLLDLIQAFFFKIFGVSWFSYVLHASFFNFLISILTFFTLMKFKLNINLSFFYSLLVSIIAYPLAGTPFVDHHAIILSILALYCFILALETKLNFYWFLIPVFFGLAFFSKQTPSAYIALIVLLCSIVHFVFYFNLKKIFIFLAGSLFVLSLFLLFIFYSKVSFLSFYQQYILFPLTIGEDRISEFLFPLEFNRLVTRFKLIHISIIILIIVLIKNIFKNYRYFFEKEFLILISIIFTSWILILHQLMSLNQKFIFFIIPILLAFSHIYYKKYFEQKKYIVYMLIFLGIGSTLYYKSSYIDNRRFQELANVDLNKSIKVNFTNGKLKNLKWITSDYPDAPENEVDLLKNSLLVIKNDKKKKMLITHYQFIAALIPEYISSPNRTYTHDSISYPKKGDEYFNVYKDFFVEQIKKNNIQIIYIIKPIENYVFNSLINENCLKSKKINDILTSYLLVPCKKLKK